jgi:hypothetical protein
MGTRAGVGRSLNYDSEVAGREATELARRELGATPSVAIVFATAGHDQEALMTGITGCLGNVPITGCSAEGVITAHGSDECSHAVAVMLIASEELSFTTHTIPGFGVSSADVGRQLAERVAGKASEQSLLLLFPDGIRGNCRELIASLEENLDTTPLIAGGTAGDMLHFDRTFQYHDGAVHSDSLSAVLITGAFDVEIAVSHGFDVVGEELTVSRAEGCLVHEIDGRSAWSIFSSYLPGDAETIDAAHIAHLSLAERVDAEDADDAFGEFVVRVPMRREKEEEDALYFAAGLTTGTRVQLALRNPQKVTEHAVDVAKKLNQRRASAPLFVIQLDCAGRGRLLFDDQASNQMVHPIREVLGEDVPWVGLHTYGEIAPVGRRTYFHNHTGVLCALYPRDDTAPDDGPDDGAG